MLYYSYSRSKMKKLIVLALCSLFLVPAFAQEVSKEEAKAAKKAAVKSHLQQHFKPYGFIRNYFTYDSRDRKSVV